MLLFSNLIEKAEGFRVNVLTDGAFGHICQKAASALKGRCKGDFNRPLQQLTYGYLCRRCHKVAL